MRISPALSRRTGPEKGKNYSGDPRIILIMTLEKLISKILSANISHLKGGVFMKRMQRRFQLFSFLMTGLIVLGTLRATPCTVAVVSGKATADGRPLLWKNRDTSVVDNKILYFNGPKYAFIGLIDARDKKGEAVWAGLNTEGFAIMNSASPDLATDEKDGNENGKFIKLALGECANAGDFENLLQRTNGQRAVAANFGIIDAEGNACFYETRKVSFEKFDANDRRVAPFGYILRTNYAFTSPKKYGGGGYIRFERASHLFEIASAEGRLNVKFILQEAARDLANEKLHSFPLTGPDVGDLNNPLYINTNDSINRNSTVSVSLFHGAPSKEKAYLATMWILLGQPVASVAVPLWPQASEIPSSLTGPETAPLNDFAKALVAYLYPDPRGHMTQYLNVTRLKNYGGVGVFNKLLQIENETLEKASGKLREWDKVKPDPKEVQEFETALVSWVFESLKSAFPDLEIKE
jgi:hypothetical protein